MVFILLSYYIENLITFMARSLFMARSSAHFEKLDVDQVGFTSSKAHVVSRFVKRDYKKIHFIYKNKNMNIHVFTFRDMTLSKRVNPT